MSKFNKAGAKAALPKQPFTTIAETTNYEGGAAFTRDAKGELFALAVTNMVGEDTFYERSGDRDDRYTQLVRQVVLEDPAWSFRFLGWLRNKANMRSASVVFAAEAVKARLEAGVTTPFAVKVPGSLDVDSRTHDANLYSSKHFVRQGMARADEPGEFLAYWTSKYGDTLPKPVKRGLEIAVVELFDEYAYSKYGKNGGPGTWGLADIVDMIHAKPKDDAQADLFGYAIDMRHSREVLVPASLPMLQHRDALMAMPQADRRKFLKRPDAQEELNRAGITWEALSGWLGGELDAAFWESVIPTMGYMALLRNLRNFDKAGISRDAARKVAARLADPAQVARSRQFPFRFLSAYKAVDNDRWVTALSDALDSSVGSLPKFPGRTLVLVDTSASMTNPISNKSTVTHLEIGGLFGVALAMASNDVDLYGFASGVFKHELPKGGSALRQIELFNRRVGEVGHGTETIAALKAAYKGHDRVILVTDMQAFRSYGGWGRSQESVTTAIPANVPMFGINPSGYASTAMDLSKPNRFEIGGFSDQVFRMVGLLAEGKGGNWPF